MKTDGGVLQESLEDHYLLEVIIKDSVDLSKTPFLGYEPNPFTLYVKHIPPGLSQWEVW
jgi:hypothetical protein